MYLVSHLLKSCVIQKFAFFGPRCLHWIADCEKTDYKIFVRNAFSKSTENLTLETTVKPSILKNSNNTVLALGLIGEVASHHSL